MQRFALIMFVLAVMVGPAHAITWCHDYTMYVVTGQDSNRTGVKKLRDTLLALHYRRFPFSNAASDPRAQRILKAGDVIIFGDQHSGVVASGGHINHFLQPAGTPGTAFTPAQAQALPSFKSGWTLIDVLNVKHHQKDYNSGKEWDVYPYRDGVVEVWRKP